MVSIRKNEDGHKKLPWEYFYKIWKSFMKCTFAVVLKQVENSSHSCNIIPFETCLPKTSPPNHPSIPYNSEDKNSEGTNLGYAVYTHHLSKNNMYFLSPSFHLIGVNFFGGSTVVMVEKSVKGRLQLAILMR